MFCSRVFKLFFVFFVIFTLFTTFPLINSFRADAGVGGNFGLEPPPPSPAFRPEPLPKRGTVGVIVEGVNKQHNVSVAALVCQRLVAKGYKVVDRNTLAAIRDDKMATAALNGDGAAVARLSSQYGVGTMITINAHAEERESTGAFGKAGVMTGTASVTVEAITSDGRNVYSDVVQGKALGGRVEAAQKAVEDAALQAVERMTQ